MVPCLPEQWVSFPNERHKGVLRLLWTWFVAVKYVVKPRSSWFSTDTPPILSQMKVIMSCIAFSFFQILMQTSKISSHWVQPANMVFSFFFSSLKGLKDFSIALLYSIQRRQKQEQVSSYWLRVSMAWNFVRVSKDEPSCKYLHLRQSWDFSLMFAQMGSTAGAPLLISGS